MGDVISLSRRTFLEGAGATLALPSLRERAFLPAVDRRIRMTAPRQVLPRVEFLVGVYLHIPQSGCDVVLLVGDNDRRAEIAEIRPTESSQDVLYRIPVSVTSTETLVALARMRSGDIISAEVTVQVLLA